MKTHLQRMKNAMLAYLKEINKTAYQKKAYALINEALEI